MTVTWYTLPDYLIAHFPRLKSAIEESYFSWLEAFENPYPHVFLEEFLLPLLLGEGEIADREARVEAGRILDELLLSPDEDLASAALTSILEMLKDDPRLEEKARPFLGPTAGEWLRKLRAGGA